MMHRLFVIALIATDIIHMGTSSASQADDVMVMLSVKSFTRTGSEDNVQQQAAMEVRNEVLSMVAQDLWELDHQSITDSNSSALDNSTQPPSQGLEGFIDTVLHMSNRRKLVLTSIGCGMLSLCCCIYCLAISKLNARNRYKFAGRESSDAPGSKPVEIWTKESEHDHYIRLIKLFRQLDDVEQTSESPPGFINATDLIEAMANKDVARELNTLGITAEDSSIIFRLLDKDNTGLVSTEDFVSGCCKEGILQGGRSFQD